MERDDFLRRKVPFPALKLEKIVCAESLLPVHQLGKPFGGKLSSFNLPIAPGGMYGGWWTFLAPGNLKDFRKNRQWESLHPRP